MVLKKNSRLCIDILNGPLPFCNCPLKMSSGERFGGKAAPGCLAKVDSIKVEDHVELSRPS